MLLYRGGERREKPVSLRWDILEFMRLRGAFTFRDSLTIKEIAEGIGANYKTVYSAVRRLIANRYISYIGTKSKKTGFYLGPNARSFLKRWPNFIDHPFYDLRRRR
ncbi:MAG: hypothetical protein DRN78_02220 [Thermoproteota archaeon]|nr:MAG: hypothetical protein DRN78_02220 [Candidatus Korarchaeota archaeon]